MQIYIPRDFTFSIAVVDRSVSHKGCNSNEKKYNLKIKLGMLLQNVFHLISAMTCREQEIKNKHVLFLYIK